MAEIKSYPNNSDEYIGAEEVMRWHHGRTSGVYGASGNAAVTAVQGEMKVNVSPGVGWLTDHQGNGICWWIQSNIELAVDMLEPPGELGRIDRVVVHWSTTPSDYAEKPEVLILPGVHSSSPVPPALTNSSTVREISLAQINIPGGAITIEPEYIIDERTNPAVCGIVTETVTVDTTTIDAEFRAFLTSIEQELADLQGGVAVELKKLMFTNVVVATGAWSNDTTYADYGKRAEVALSGVTQGMVPEVIFDVDDATNGGFAPVAKSYNGGVYIYAESIPGSPITIPTIICWRDNA